MDKIALIFQHLKIVLFDNILGFIGGLTPQLRILLNLIAADFLMYLFLLLRKKGLPPGVSRQFFRRKAACFMLIGVAKSIDTLTNAATSTLYNIVMYYFISVEGMSIINLSNELGLPIPEKLLMSVKALADRARGDTAAGTAKQADDWPVYVEMFNDADNPGGSGNPAKNAGQEGKK